MKATTILFSLFLALPAFGEITASPAAVTVYARHRGTFSWHKTTPPPETMITISGTGAWNITRGGELNTACFWGSGYCFNAVSAITNNASGAVPTGNGNGTVYISSRGLASQALSLGQHTGTLTIGSTVVALTLIVLPENAYDDFVYQSGYPSGCANTDAEYPHADTCAITEERPASGSFSIPAGGGSYIDPQFGHRVSRTTPSGQTNAYSALSAFSATAEYVLAADLAGSTHVFARESAVMVYSSLPGINVSSAAWDPEDD